MNEGDILTGATEAGASVEAIGVDVAARSGSSQDMPVAILKEYLHK